MMNLNYLIFLSLLTLASCAIDDDLPIDPCQDEQVGSYDLIETTVDVFPYLDLPAESNIIFRNELGEEATYNIHVPFNSDINLWITKPCPENEADEIHFGYETEYKSMDLRSVDNAIAFGLSLQVKLDVDNPLAGNVADVFSIFVFDSIEDSFRGFQVFNMVVEQRTSTTPIFAPEYFEYLEINNKTLTDVYKTDLSDPFIILYYSFEEGIVAFTDADDVQWVLDRIE